MTLIHLSQEFPHTARDVGNSCRGNNLSLKQEITYKLRKITGLPIYCLKYVCNKLCDLAKGYTYSHLLEN